MKIAKQKPEGFRTAVYVTKDKYELFHAEPVSLGTIERQGLYWYTADGMRFLNNRDALDYLLKLRAHNAASASFTAAPTIVVPASIAQKAKEETAATKPAARPKLVPKKSAPPAPTLRDVYHMLGKVVAARHEEATKELE